MQLQETILWGSVWKLWKSHREKSIKDLRTWNTAEVHCLKVRGCSVLVISWCWPPSCDFRPLPRCSAVRYGWRHTLFDPVDPATDHLWHPLASAQRARGHWFEGLADGDHYAAYSGQAQSGSSARHLPKLGHRLRWESVAVNYYWSVESCGCSVRCCGDDHSAWNCVQDRVRRSSGACTLVRYHPGRHQLGKSLTLRTVEEICCVDVKFFSWNEKNFTYLIDFHRFCFVRNQNSCLNDRFNLVFDRPRPIKF